MDEHTAENDAGHKQVHRPATGDSECTCGQWEGPMTTLPASDPRSFGAHLARVFPPDCPACGKPVAVSKHWGEWACSDSECVNAHGPGPGGGHVIPPGKGQ